MNCKHNGLYNEDKKIYNEDKKIYDEVMNMNNETGNKIMNGVDVTNKCVVVPVGLPIGVDNPKVINLVYHYVKDTGILEHRLRINNQNLRLPNSPKTTEDIKSELTKLESIYGKPRISRSIDEMRNTAIPQMKLAFDVQLAQNGGSLSSIKDYIQFYFDYYSNFIKIDDGTAILTYEGLIKRLPLSEFKNRLSSAWAGFVRDRYSISMLSESEIFDEVLSSTKKDIESKVDILVNYGGNYYGVDFCFEVHTVSKKGVDYFCGDPRVRLSHKEIEVKPNLRKEIPIFRINIYRCGYDVYGGIYLPEGVSEVVEEFCIKYNNIYSTEQVA